MSKQRDRDRRLIAEGAPWRTKYAMDEYPTRKQMEALAREANRIAREVKREQRRSK